MKHFTLQFTAIVLLMISLLGIKTSWGLHFYPIHTHDAGNPPRFYNHVNKHTFYLVCQNFLEVGHCSDIIEVNGTYSDHLFAPICERLGYPNYDALFTFSEAERELDRCKTPLASFCIDFKYGKCSEIIYTNYHFNVDELCHQYNWVHIEQGPEGSISYPGVVNDINQYNLSAEELQINFCFTVSPIEEGPPPGNPCDDGDISTIDIYQRGTGSEGPYCRYADY